MSYSFIPLVGIIVVSQLFTPAWATADGPDFYAVTRVAGTDSLALRSKPSIQGRLLIQIPFNALKVKNKVARQNDWCKVEYKRVTGWASCHYLTESSGQHYYATIGYTDKLNIRRTPQINSPIVGTIPPLETGIQGNGECNAAWCPINYQGKKGWVGQRYLMSWSF